MSQSDAYDEAALYAASVAVHMHLLREGSSWGTKACEEMGRIFMTAYLRAAPPSSDARTRIEHWASAINVMATKQSPILGVVQEMRAYAATLPQPEEKPK